MMEVNELIKICKELRAEIERLKLENKRLRDGAKARRPAQRVGSIPRKEH
jgi:hypothetical protein